MSKYAKEVNRCLLSIRAGDKSAMETLFDITANHLKVVIKYYLIDKSYLDDVLLQTYERAFSYINSFNSEFDGYNWLCGIAKNLAYAYNKKEITTCDIDSLNLEDVSDDWVNNIETQIDLSRAIKDLDDIDKEIVFLRFYMHDSLSKIAQKLGVSKVAIHKRLKRICKIIREEY